jgi:hypothetical protein
MTQTDRFHAARYGIVVDKWLQRDRQAEAGEQRLDVISSQVMLGTVSVAVVPVVGKEHVIEIVTAAFLPHPGSRNPPLD